MSIKRKGKKAVAKTKASPKKRSSATASRAAKRSVAVKSKAVKKSVKAASKKITKVVAKKSKASNKQAKRKKPIVSSAAKKKAAVKSIKTGTTKKASTASAKSSSKITSQKSAASKKTINQVPAAKQPKFRATSALEVKKTRDKVVMLNTKKRSREASANFGTMGVPPYEEKRDEEYMGDTQREHFRKILHLWKRELMEEVDRTMHHMQDEAANFPDPNDRATQEEEFSLELRTRDRERKLIKKIEEALEKIENMDYGYCDACGIEIGIRRLEARPTANLCIDCKTLDEIKERQMGG